MLASGSLPKAICMILLGLLLGIVGTDVNSGVARFDFGIPELQDGIDFAAVAMGVFGFAEIMTNLELKDQRVDLTSKIGSLYPNKQEFKESWPAVIRGTALGSALGILPGGGRSFHHLLLTRSRKKYRATRNASARVIRLAWPAPNPPITLRLKQPLFRC